MSGGLWVRVTVTVVRRNEHGGTFLYVTWSLLLLHLKRAYYPQRSLLFESRVVTWHDLFYGIYFLIFPQRICNL